MLKNRHLFPAVYAVFLLPTVLGYPIRAKVVLFVACAGLAFIINARPIVRIVILFLTSLCTLVPFLILVQSAVCSSLEQIVWQSLTQCVLQRSFAVLINVGLFSSVLLLAVANEWQESLVTTINRMWLPRNIRVMIIVSGAMIGEFRRAMLRVHHAYTARGEAMPSVNWRNLIVLPSMLGAVWASVLNGSTERLKGQWSSDRFWTRYVPAGRPSNTGTALSDVAVLCAGGIAVGVLLEPLLF